MNNSIYPFLLTERKDKGGVWYVRLRADDGTLLPRKSTGTRNKDEAIKISFNWYRNGGYTKKKTKETIKKEKRTLEKLDVFSKLKTVKWTTDDVIDIMELLKKGKYISNYTLRKENDSDSVGGFPQTPSAYKFLINF